jgi:hypothetical protein
MVEVKKSSQVSIKLKDIMFINNGSAVDEKGNAINIINALKVAFGTTPFNLSASTKVEDVDTIDDSEE